MDVEETKTRLERALETHPKNAEARRLLQLLSQRPAPSDAAAVNPKQPGQ